MNYYKRLDINTILKASVLRDVLGIGTAVAGVAGMAGQVSAQHLANEANIEIAEKNNQTAIDIHEKDMAFNAEQAQITRDWNSETEVMKRRAEAGLNVAGQGGGSSGTGGGSNAQASAPAAPQLTTPQVQAPDIAGAINAAVNLAKAPSEISNTKAATKESEKNIEKIGADANLAMEQAFATKINNMYSPQLLSAQIRTELATAKHLGIEAYKAQSFALKAKADVETNFYNMFLQTAEYQLDSAKAIMEYEQHWQAMQQEAYKTLAQHKMNLLNSSYQYGEKLSLLNSASQRGRLGNTIGLNVGLEMGIQGGYTAGIRGVPLHPVSIESNMGFKGGINVGAYFQTTADYEALLSESNSKLMTVQNSLLYNKGIRMLQNAELLKTAKTAKERVAALQDLGELYNFMDRYIQAMRQIQSNFTSGFPSTSNGAFAPTY